MEIKNKVVLVTGVSSDIGKATAELFIKKGAKVVLAARSLKEVKELAKMFGRYDLVEVIRHVGSEDRPVLAYITPPDRVALVTPSDHETKW